MKFRMYHEKCFENEAMGAYFIQDPDGYWLEIVPVKNKGKVI